MSPRDPAPPGRRAGAMAAGIVCLGTAAAYLLDTAGVWDVRLDVGAYAFASGMAAAGAVGLAHRSLAARRRPGPPPAAEGADGGTASTGTGPADGGTGVDGTGPADGGKGR